MMLFAWLSVARAGGLWPVETGQTVESIAETLGDPGYAQVLRELNGLGPAEQPRIGRLLAYPDTASTSEQRAFLEAVLGEVSVAPRGGSPQTAQRLVELPLGATVCTGPASYALLQVATTCVDEAPESDEVVLWSETCATIRGVGATRAGRATVVEVIRGSLVVADAGKAPGRVSVVAGAGVATGTGGFRVHLEPDEALRAEALTARLALLGDDRQVDLEAGQGARVLADGSIPSVVDLLGAGPLTSPDVGEPLRRGQFRWSPTPEAFGYRIALSADPEGKRQLHHQSVSRPVYTPEMLLLPVEPGEPIWWTVATLDRFGFLGVSSPRRPFGLPWEGAP
ncbi:MAG: hypothetical protein AAF211_00725 [Myxococcota bacterium]